jgi:hypothetical protein
METEKETKVMETDKESRRRWRGGLLLWRTGGGEGGGVRRRNRKRGWKGRKKVGWWRQRRRCQMGMYKLGWGLWRRKRVARRWRWRSRARIVEAGKVGREIERNTYPFLISGGRKSLGFMIKVLWLCFESGAWGLVTALGGCARKIGREKER